MAARHHERVSFRAEANLTRHRVFRGFRFRLRLRKSVLKTADSVVRGGHEVSELFRKSVDVVGVARGIISVP